MTEWMIDSTRTNLDGFGFHGQSPSFFLFFFSLVGIGLLSQHAKECLLQFACPACLIALTNTRCIAARYVATGMCSMCRSLPHLGS